MRQLLFAGLLAAWAVPTAAQTAPPAGRRWYGGLQATYQRYNGLGQAADHDTASPYAFFGPTGQLGYWLNPRTALEIGAGLGYRDWHTVPWQGYGIPEACGYYRSRSLSLAVPLQVHSQLLAPGRRWGLESQAGVVFVQQWLDSEYLGEFCQPLSGGPVRTGFQAVGRDLPALLGLAATCRLAPRWQVVAQAQATFSWRYLFDPANDSFAVARPGGGASVGFRYGW